MPYIKQEDRPELDKLIDLLADEIIKGHDKYGYDGAFAGLLNYSVTTLSNTILKRKFGALRYWQVALLSGTFHNIADEFYRRAAVPYEDIQIDANGDVGYPEGTQPK